MQGLIQLFVKDYKQENFTRKEWLIYGILAPIAFLAVCILASAQY